MPFRRTERKEPGQGTEKGRLPNVECLPQSAQCAYVCCAPAGRCENCPPFQRWVTSDSRKQVPEARPNDGSAVPPGLGQCKRMTSNQSPERKRRIRCFTPRWRLRLGSMFRSGRGSGTKPHWQLNPPLAAEQRPALRLRRCDDLPCGCGGATTCPADSPPAVDELGRVDRIHDSSIGRASGC